jgi:hypothetical protein
VTVIRLQDGKAIVEDGKVGIAAECCCGCALTCGEDCQQTVTVNFSAGGFDGQITYTVADGGVALDFDEMPEFYNLASSYIFCSVVDGCAQWTLSFTVCYFDGVDTISEDYEGFIEADSNGCPKTGNVTMNLTFGDGESTVTASIA